MPADLLFVIGDIVVGLLGGLSRSADDDRAAQEERRRARAIAVTLERVGELLPGRAWKPFLRAPRVAGFLDGRPVTLIWRGAEHLELRATAPPGLRLAGSLGGWLARLLHGPQPRLTGDAGPAAEALLALMRAGRLDGVQVADGHLTATLRPGLNAERIVTLTRQIMGALWAPAAPARVVVTPRSGEIEPALRPSEAGAPAAGASELRCPFCHDAIAPDAVVAHCASCDAPHHPTCFEEAHGCSIAGCRQAKSRASRQGIR